MAPDVDITIGFLDGFSWKLVGISYGCFIGFSIIVELANCMIKRHRGEDVEEANAGPINYSDGNLANPNKYSGENNLNATDNSVS